MRATVPLVVRWVRGARFLRRLAITGALVLAVPYWLEGSPAVASASLLSPVGRTLACSSSVARAPLLGTVQTTFISGMPSPFGVAFSSNGRFVFVDSPASAVGPGSELTMYAMGPSGHLVADATGTFAGSQLLGMSRSPDGRYLAAASDSGAQIFSTSRMEHGAPASSSWLVGSLASTGQGAIETAFSPDGHYLFVTLEDSREMAVFNFTKAVQDAFGPSDVVGYVPLGLDPVGMALSPNGRDLYATSEEYPSASAHAVPGGTCTQEEKEHSAQSICDRPSMTLPAQ